MCVCFSVCVSVLESTAETLLITFRRIETHLHSGAFIRKTKEKISLGKTLNGNKISLISNLQFMVKCNYH